MHVCIYICMYVCTYIYIYPGTSTRKYTAVKPPASMHRTRTHTIVVYSLSPSSLTFSKRNSVQYCAVLGQLMAVKFGPYPCVQLPFGWETSQLIAERESNPIADLRLQTDSQTVSLLQAETFSRKHSLTVAVTVVGGKAPGDHLKLSTITSCSLLYTQTTWCNWMGGGCDVSQERYYGTS